MVHHVDNLELLKRTDAQSIDLIYIDPPFNTGSTRRTVKIDGPSYADHWAGGLQHYLDFLQPRLEEMHRVLAAHGTIYVHVDWHAGHYVKVLLDQIFGIRNFMNEIIWHYRTGGVARRWFGRKHDTMLVYARQMGRQRFNPQRNGRYRTNGLNYDTEGRPYKTTRRGRLYFDARGPLLTDVWEIPFLSTVASERCGYPSQKPLTLLRRIVEASTQPGDLVADYFCGSGTTLVAALQLKRRYIGCDINTSAVRISRKRLESAGTAIKKNPTP
ncbi:MAG: DNA adenine methyltransferase YhdJ [Phycisphaerae bacterium]|nr:DNA adenine methyltransferase YhdJ [Phycisphaerae bacterium]